MNHEHDLTPRSLSTPRSFYHNFQIALTPSTANRSDPEDPVDKILNLSDPEDLGPRGPDNA